MRCQPLLCHRLQAGLNALLLLTALNAQRGSALRHLLPYRLRFTVPFYRLSGLKRNPACVTISTVLLFSDNRMNTLEAQFLNRRQFLKLLLAAGLLPFSSQRINLSTASPLPVWWQDLHQAHQAVHGPGMPPYGMPGSIMKLVATTALLEEKMIHPDTTLECRGSLTRQGQRFRCQHPHGKRTLIEAIGLSCNVFFAQAVDPLSANRFLQYANVFQLHRPVAEGAQFLFPKETGMYRPAQDFALGLNRNLQPNALQLLRMSRLIATGNLPDTRPETRRILQQGMRLAATHGTAAELDAHHTLHIAAKTGTTEHGHTYQSWLIGYFPFEDPRYIFCTHSNFGTAKDQAVPLANTFLQSRRWP
jgi:hypothetical protein